MNGEECEHQWQDTTTAADVRRHYRCIRCGAEKWLRRIGCGCHS